MTHQPKVGETIIVSLSGNDPILIRITGFGKHPRYPEGTIEFERPNGGGPSWTINSNKTWFPEIPIDHRYYYTTVLVYEDFYGNIAYRDEAWFFTPEEAFEHCTDDHIVEVRKIL